LQEIVFFTVLNPFFTVLNPFDVLYHVIKVGQNGILERVRNLLIENQQVILGQKEAFYLCY